jgi:acetolactate synthase-1/2/3 large subunit
MKVSHYVIDFLSQHGVHDIFTVSGGGIMHLVDSLGRRPGVRYVCNFHEQACAIAAEAYARVRDSVGACIVTTGPGSTNALSGLAGAFVDSVPVIVISGQVRRDIIADYAKLRQLGPQEINIEPMVRPVVKYFKTLMDPAMLRYELEAALWHATTGRPGPAWINIPLDVQGAEFEPEGSVGFDPPLTKEPQLLVDQVGQLIAMLKRAQRPVVIGGNGIHLGRAQDLFREFIDRLGAPVLSTIGGLDLLDEANPLYMGRFGPTGQRRANFTLQNSDLVLSIGASMSISSIGFNTAGFAPKAKRIMVTNDSNDLEKPNYKPDLGIAVDANAFFREFLRQANGTSFHFSPHWREACARWKSRYPIVTPDYLSDTEHVNSYVFAKELSTLLDASAVVVTGNSLDIVSILHSFEVKQGQRVFTNINFGAMGWDLPGAVGACIGSGERQTCLVTGDGSLMFNLQEMLTIRANNLPVKIFVLNNDGYESIRATQKNFFEGNLVGSDFRSGIANPDFRQLAGAFGFRYASISSNDEIREKLTGVLGDREPVLCELNLSPDQPRSPKTMSYRRPDGSFETRPLEDQFPFLPRGEIHENMHLFDDSD